ncbi:hypothetical protein RYX36_034283 [Vicia faba]
MFFIAQLIDIEIQGFHNHKIVFPNRKFTWPTQDTAHSSSPPLIQQHAIYIRYACTLYWHFLTAKHMFCPASCWVTAYLSSFSSQAPLISQLLSSYNLTTF